MTSLIDGLVLSFSPTHLLGVIAIGLLAGQSGRRLSGMALVPFAFGLAAGSVAIAAGIGETPAALALLVFAGIAGLVVVVALPPPSLLIFALALIIGAALALNSPPQAVSIPSAGATQFGTALAALTAFVLVTFVASKAEHGWQRIGIRILGSWIAASAILVLALRLAR